MMARVWLGLLVLELIGAAMLTLVCSELRRWGLSAKLGLSFGLGLVTLTISLFLASRCGLKPAWWFGVVEFLVLAAAVVRFRRGQLGSWLLRRAVHGAITPRRRLRRFEVVLMLFIAGVCIVVSAASLLEPLVEWDVIAIWALKGKVLLHESVNGSAYFHDVSKAYSHLDYPLLWPLAMSWVWCWAGEPDMQAVKALAPALLCSFAALFYGLLARCQSRGNSLLFTALLLGLPMVLSQTSRLLTDALLSFFVVGAFICCYLWLEFAATDDLRLAGFFTAGMLFTKNEGLGLFVVLLVTMAIALLVQRKLKHSLAVAVWLLGLPLVATAVWYAFRSGIPKVSEDYGSRMNPVYFLQNISRVPEILAGSVTYWGSVEDWLIFWPVFVLTLVATIKHWPGRPIRFLAAGLALVLLMYGYIYVVSPWTLADLMATTASRLLLHIAPLACFLMAESARAAGLLAVLAPQERQR